ncbi:transcriptional repressor [Dyadobacter psychrophilus]|uniref:Ferric uptake regulator family protein n=1 Tax=Dyadobacter psychrophilus TaxID=651661 RepID=A0A1T5DZR4_9BACT|nr:transcriptional repressor [Dyadobacter psychrophilus]SKB77282.1 Ferric uptake regulator family protein [Dyadobacter psychrophilus]
MSLINDINLYCRENKIRQIGKRIIVAQHFMIIGEEVNGDALWRSLRKSQIKISLATVYSTLNWLYEAGLIDKKTTIERKNLFVLKGCPDKAR